MTDFVDSLKDIKKELLKEQGANLSKNDTQSVNLGENLGKNSNPNLAKGANSVANSSKNSAQNANAATNKGANLTQNAEFESPQAKEKRLQAEIAEFIKGEN